MERPAQTSLTSTTETSTEAMVEFMVCTLMNHLRCGRKLSVQCNTLHGTEYNITCGVTVSMGWFSWQISQKQLKIDTRFQ